jgi:Dolichyl-phosphate-mannose-protein mannosyltransferase
LYNDRQLVIQSQHARDGFQNLGGHMNIPRVVVRHSTSIAAALLLITHAALLLVSSRLQFPTRNEVAHVPSALLCWQTGSHGLYNVNPPPWKMLATLPSLLLNPRLDGIEPPASPGQRPEWGVAWRFAENNSADYFEIIWLARLAGICWSVLGGFVIFRWANELYARPAGLLALTIWCFEPNVLAHGQLVTPDMPATVAGLVATYVFWHYLRSGTWSLALAAGALLGVAQLTKFTMLILYGIWPVLMIAHSLDRSNIAYRSLTKRTRLLQGGLIVTISVMVINLGYEFDGSLDPLGKYDFVSCSFTGQVAETGDVGREIRIGNRFRGTWTGKIPSPLPADYLIGIDVQRKDFEKGMTFYLAGEWRKGHGWWYYYLYGLAIKVPLGTLALVLWGLALVWFPSRRFASLANELTLWLPAIGILGLVSSETGFNRHVRYILPITPFVAIATGKLVGFLRRGRFHVGIVVMMLLLWSITSSLLVYPHSLSYFNELAGGPDRGYAYLVDSNIDWGQDLFFFKKWADCHPDARPIGLAYLNYIDYRVVGAEYDEIPRKPRPGWFAVDVDNLMLPNRRCNYFQRFQPVTKAGYSIFIYYISVEEAERVRAEMGLLHE